MTAFLFIPARDESRSAQRVDFDNIASLFVEADDLPPSRRWRSGVRLAMTLVLLLLAVGDTLLVARSSVLMGSVGGSLARGQSIHSISL
jgi:hypothetical protein